MFFLKITFIAGEESKKPLVFAWVFCLGAAQQRSAAALA
jgi:hypothetical protein